jgi:hypothetical protein
MCFAGFIVFKGKRDIDNAHEDKEKKRRRTKTVTISVDYRLVSTCDITKYGPRLISRPL